MDSSGAARCVAKHGSNKLARPEGFEPPTLRSEVRSVPYAQGPAWKRRFIFQRNLNPSSVLVLTVSRRCGNTDGNKRRGHIQLSGLYFCTSSIARSAVDLNRSVAKGATAALSPIPQNSANLLPTHTRSLGVSLIAFWYSKLRALRISKLAEPNSVRRVLKKWSRTTSSSLCSANPALTPASTAKNNNQATSSSNRSSPTTFETALKGPLFMTSAGRSGRTIRRNWIASFLGAILGFVSTESTRLLIA